MWVHWWREYIHIRYQHLIKNFLGQGWASCCASLPLQHLKNCLHLGNACLPFQMQSWELRDLICRPDFPSEITGTENISEQERLACGSSALRGTSHESLCFWNCTNRNPNTLAVWFQEPPRKIWSIEFTLKEATATESLEVLWQLFWVSKLNYSTLHALCAYTEHREKHCKGLLLLVACVIWCDKFKRHLLPHNLLYFCFVFLVLRQVSGEIN